MQSYAKSGKSLSCVAKCEHNTKNFYFIFDSILNLAGLKGLGFTPYSLQHTCATLLLAAGENPKFVAERLGHTSVKMTLDTYSHILPDMQQAATDKLEAMLYRKKWYTLKVGTQ